MMDGGAQAPEGFTWSGTLDDTDIRALYAACHSLRFSGRLELRDGAQRAEVVFVGGDPIEIDGGDTQRIALWNRGTFRAVQSIPTLSGELTSQRSMQGNLEDVKPSQLWAFISEYRLTCEIELERPSPKGKETAVVSFSNGHAEHAQVNGMPELAALARVSSWTDGTFRVTLKPLFVDGVIPHAPPMPGDGPPLDPRQFDVSRSIPMDLKSKALPTPPLGELVQTAKPTFGAQRGDRVQTTQPLPPPRGPEDERTTAPDGEIPPALMVPKKRGSGALLWAALLSLLIAGGVGAAYYFHLPPFSPPPKPLVEPPAPVEPHKPPVVEDKPVEAKPEQQKPVEKPVEAKPEQQKPVEKPVEAKLPKDDEEKEPPKAVKDKATRLIQKGRMLLAEGHEHTALEWFKRAEKLVPKDAALKVYEQQALGKLGRGEIWIEGKGAVTIDGHRFQAPRKLKLPAGPHAVDEGAGESELTLKRGEKKRIKAKK